MEETIEGYVDHIIFQNRDNGYTVACLVSQGEEITCVGTFRFLNEGETIRARGVYTTHPSYGRQFSVSSYETVIPGTLWLWNGIWVLELLKESERLSLPGS